MMAAPPRAARFPRRGAPEIGGRAERSRNHRYRVDTPILFEPRLETDASVPQSVGRSEIIDPSQLVPAIARCTYSLWLLLFGGFRSFHSTVPFRARARS